MGIINVSKLHKELVAAGIPIDGVDSDGNISFQPTATDQQRIQAQAILAAHDPTDFDAIDLANFKQAVRTVYQNTITRLEQIQNAGTVPLTVAGFNQVVSAVQDEALAIERILKLLSKMI